MKIGLQTWGSNGDVRPMIALGAELVRRGHQATIAIAAADNRDYSALCAQVGLAHIRAPERYDVGINGLMDKLEGSASLYNLLRVLLEEALYPGLDAMYSAAQRLCAECDLVVGHFLTWPLKIAAGERGTPHATVTFWPGMVPNPLRAPLDFPSLGARINRLLWQLSQWAVDRSLGEGFRTFWRRHGLNPRHTIPEACFSEELNLISASSLLRPSECDWEKNRYCGYFQMPDAGESLLPGPIRDFLDAGLPPILLTLGSPAEIDAIHCEDLLTEIAKEASVRAIIQVNANRALPIDPKGRILYIHPTSHVPLLKHCALAVHHGGAGTTHSVLAAGKPAVVIGFMEEQLSWGRQLKRLGVCGGVFRYPHVSSHKVAEAIWLALESPGMARRAEEMSHILNAERGTGVAATYLEELVRNR